MGRQRRHSKNESDNQVSFFAKKCLNLIRKEPEITAEQLADPKKRLEHMVNLFLGVVPENLRSSYEQEELGHEQVFQAANFILKFSSIFEMRTQLSAMA
jgi:hypothetical protein